MGGSTVKSFIAGLADATMTVNGFFYSGAGDVEAVLANYRTGGSGTELTVCPEGVADGSPCYHLRDALCTNVTTSANLTSAVALNHTWQADGGSARLLVLYEASPTASADGAGVDFGSVGVAGSGEAVIHCTSVTGAGTIDVKLQESSDNGVGDAWADIADAEFTQLDAIGSERITWSGAAEQYVRAVITIAGFTGCTLFVAAKTGGTNA